jgi:hypothetical protein
MDAEGGGGVARVRGDFDKLSPNGLRFVFKEGHSKHSPTSVRTAPVEVPPRLGPHFAVGITNSAPFAVLSGQRCMIDFCLV